ncbi:MAG: sulfatase [Deltaproteobacteria bacterium]|nr:sulfatase [Deltaproteobacteria bacterium]
MVWWAGLFLQPAAWGCSASTGGDAGGAEDAGVDTMDGTGDVDQDRVETEDGDRDGDGDAEDAVDDGTSGDSRPNIVVVMTDDQTLADLRVMTATQRLVGDAGTSFDTFYIPYALCCPSRATFLTGQHCHNHGVLYNKLPTGGYTRLDHDNTLAVWLEAAGYATVHIGKYLNGYGRDAPSTGEEVPPGWTEWYGTVGGSTYRMYDYTVNDDGVLVDFGFDAADYQTDVLAAEAEAVVRRLAPQDRPFFLWFCPLAPHREEGVTKDYEKGTLVDVTEIPPLPPGGRDASDARRRRPPTPKGPFDYPGNPRPAPRHEGVFADEALPRPPSFNEADLSDKADVLASELPLLRPAQIVQLEIDYRARLESLLAVDEAVARIVAALEEAGEIDRTVLMFTSDNGYFLGEHRHTSKYLPYEEGIHVPLMIRGPGFPPGLHVASPVANVDLAPTIAALAGAVPGIDVDGISLLDVRTDPAAFDGRTILLGAGENSDGLPIYHGIRVPGWTYLEWESGDVELYDLAADPFQIDSAHDLPGLATRRAELAALLGGLRGCAGAACFGLP